ncbi:CRAL/TRIO domain-containing protein [Toxoplasma gondii RUB]|uniref:CRAL/TRIO domain-containing protein n=6 Tax=Toxoplasma gondii TaxID=5811 RepID=A0A2G8YBW5_TOXGO|nr:CRAL/TRIO domain-containing protein [Toxoplasma gondii FOU]KFG64608.1 CRAL/TRIO domain-containing protein [Toxoplasma gondii RUB]KFH12483.1 CRAL/TRIO domain-containing protein [Toxoplasma gondii VAND]KFH16198.1 CRAL/TRIO domain-containing protein [Toxoplasma gondii MAS]PIM04767.1 CRAL/TRIO domain-containing protein [Toxoplasma gondii COUG]PUA90502.1 CRAL/TRIO domain-containing protein [Toxoplasma gondii TgCATBr9]
MASSAPSDAAVSDPVVGPPPVLCIFPFRDPALPVPRRHKIILMKRRVRLQQEALLLHRQKKETSGKTNSADASKGQEAQKLYLASPLTGFEVNWIMDDSNLERFLRAREWNVPKAFALLMETVKFRREAKPERVKPKEVMQANQEGIMYRRGYDKSGHPILYMRPGKNQPNADADSSIKLLVYMLERAVQSMKRQEGVSGITFIVDYNGYTNANQPPLAVALRFVDIFQNFYPERLAAAFVIDTPWYFSTFWNCLQPFLPNRTTSKIHYCSTSDPKSLEPLFDQVPADCIESWIPGGQATGVYDHSAYWAAEAKQFECYMKFLQEEFIGKSQQQRMVEARAFQEAQAAGKQGDEAVEAARAAAKDDKKGGNGAADSDTLLEKEEGEEDVQDEEDEESNADLNEDEEKRRMLQEALKKEQGGHMADTQSTGAGR